VTLGTQHFVHLFNFFMSLVAS